MKNHQENPSLTSYVLNELPAEEAAKLDYSIAADPALRLVIEEIERSQSELTEAFGVGSDKLLPRQRAAIMRAAKEAARKGKVTQLKSHRQLPITLLWPVAAAAVIGGGIFLMTLVSPNAGKSGKRQVASNTDSKVQQSPGAEIDGDGAVVGLPLTAGKRSLAMVASSIREKQEMPAKDTVRIEELLNAFPLQTQGTKALWKGCSIGVEVIQCPWKPSSSLAFVDIRGAKDDALELSMEFRKNDDSIVDHRILGFTDSQGGKIFRAVEAGSENFIAILVNGRGDELGNMVWTVGGEAAPAVPFEINSESEPSDDARFAALICSYGLWLRGEEKVDAGMLLGTAREVAAKSMVPDRFDFLELIDQSVKLAGE